jgi:hypothetical protein
VSNFLEEYGMPVSESGRKLDAAVAKLGLAERTVTKQERRARLMFGLDLTGSREASLRNARVATAAMFEAIKSIGSIAVKLVYYRGTHECRAGVWHDDAGVVSRFMLGLSCEGGNTQIARVLRLALDEAERPDAVVFIGDHSEEPAEKLMKLAENLGKRRIPLFVFHECAGNDAASLEAKPLFKRLATVTGGVYCEFKSSSGTVLRELLSNVAAFSSAGKAGLTQMGDPSTPQARQFQKDLLLLAAPEGAQRGKRE